MIFEFWFKSIPIIIITPKKPIRIFTIEDKLVLSLRKKIASGMIKNIFEKFIIVMFESGINLSAVKLKNIAEIPKIVLKKWNLRNFFLISYSLNLFNISKIVNAKIDLKNIISITWCWSIINLIKADITEKHKAANIIQAIPLIFFFELSFFNVWYLKSNL